MNEKLKAEYARQIYKDTECWTTKEVYEYFAEVVYQNEQLKERIDKAINLLQNNQFIWSAMDDEILEILKGESND